MSGSDRPRLTAVVVDDPLLPWQRTVLEALERSGLTISVSARPSNRQPRSLAVRTYARLDRWPSSVDRADGVTAVSADPDLVLDLTAAGTTSEAVTSTPTMFLHPRALDEDAMLAELAAGRQVFRIEVRVKTAAGERCAATSTVALTRYSARRSAERIRERAGGVGRPRPRSLRLTRRVGRTPSPPLRRRSSGQRLRQWRGSSRVRPAPRPC